MQFHLRSAVRVHMSLIDLNGSLGRIDGGYGITLSDPSFLLYFSDEGIEKFQYLGPYEYRTFVESIITKICAKYHLSFNNLYIKIEEFILPHMGLGSKTQLLLSVAKGLCHLKQLHPSIVELTTLVQRGGTSGVGYQAFEQGGFILDSGHTYGPGQQKNSFLPSSVSTAPPAQLLIRYSLPENWRILLIIPNVKQGANNIEEINVFQKYCPVPKADVEQITHRILMQILPGFATGDLKAISQGQRFINSHGFKAVEIGLQHPFVQHFLSDLETSYQLPVGMSSFGPAIFVITESMEQALQIKKNIQEKLTRDRNYPQCALQISKPNNHGHEILP
jgi:beta-ribofuranosylaminobenzene 5'-phosphate synthase